MFQAVGVMASGDWHIVVLDGLHGKLPARRGKGGLRTFPDPASCDHDASQGGRTWRAIHDVAIENTFEWQIDETRIGEIEQDRIGQEVGFQLAGGNGKSLSA